MKAREWHYLKGGREWGPVTRAEIEEMVAEGYVEPDVLVRRIDSSDWLPLSDAVDMSDQSAPLPVLPADGVLTYEIPRPMPQRAYATFGQRFGGFLVDYFLVAIPLVVGLHALRRAGLPVTEPVQQATIVLVAWLYLTLTESSRLQGTFGKRVAGLIVTDLHGQPISLGRAAGRSAAKALSFGTLYIGFLLALITPRKQALHDLLAGTLVLRK
jgi:uncharacterized RDD family membrane protein YckC